MDWALAIAILSLAVSGLSFIAAWLTYKTTEGYSKIQTAFALHSKLFETREDFALLYVERMKTDWFFSETDTKDESSFLGSKEEKKIDIFLERLNFVCMWLLSIKPPGDEDKLFHEYIEELYTAPFFKQYFSFLRDARRERKTPYYEFIHTYAERRLKGLKHPQVPYAKSRKELDEMKATDPSAQLTRT